jgi:hypothetical protein
MTRRLIVAMALVLGLIGPASAMAAAAPAASATDGALVSAPISTSLVQGDETWLVVPMGHLGDFLNTFWQLFVRSSSGDGWVTVTPPGVADNGGLVITDGPNGGLLAGFLPNQDLIFSPLSVTTDGGHTWTGVYFPQGLAAVPDALGGATSGSTLGLGRSTSGTLLETGVDLTSLSSWRSVTTAGHLGHSAPGTRCGVSRLTAIAQGPPGVALIGASCTRRGVVGLFHVAGGDVSAVAVPASSTLAGATVSVLRLVPTATGVAMLLAAHERSGRTALVAGWLATAAQSVRLSRPIPVPLSAKLVASGTTPGGGLFVLLQPPGGRAPELADIAPPGSGQSAWDVPPAPPRGTLGVAFSPGRIDAVTVQSSTLTDFSLDSSGTWVQSQVVKVPIQYGSSS